MMGSSLDTDLPAPWDFTPQGCEKQTLLCTSLSACGAVTGRADQVLKQVLAGPPPQARQCKFYILVRKHLLRKRASKD